MGLGDDIKLEFCTSNVLDLAETIYMGCLAERMPILADALMDAGCTDEAILKHLMEPERNCGAVSPLITPRSSRLECAVLRRILTIGGRLKKPSYREFK